MNEPPVRLHAVGDIGIVGRLAERLAEHASPYPFQRVAPSLAADIVFGNLEIPFSGGARITAHESPRLETPEGAAERLAAAGFQVLSLANNHIMDFGSVGLETTRRRLAAAGIATVGAGADLAEARRALVVERRGLRVGFLAYSVPCAASATLNRPGAAPLVLEIVRDDLSRLRDQADCTVVSLHFGMMYLEHPTPQDMTLADAICGAGADVILGHHPHVLQGIEERPRSVIAYSLGEFVFDPEAGNYYARVARETRRRSLVLRAELARREARLLPSIAVLAGEDLCPRVLEGERARSALGALDRLSAALHDPAARRAFWRYAGGELLAYQLSGLWFDLRRGQLGHVVRRLPRLRTRHLKLVLGYLRGALAGRSAWR